MPPPRKRSRLTRNSRTFSGFKFYLGYLNITVILNLFQKFVIQKLGGNTGCFENSRRRTGCQEVKPLSVLRTKITSVISLPSCPLFLWASDCYPPQPSLIREGECVDWCRTLSYNDRMNLIHSLEGSTNERRAKRRRAGDGVAVPLFANEQDKEGVGDTYPSSGTKCHLLPQRGEGRNKKFLNHRSQSDILKILKQVQDDRNISLKPTYSPIHLFTYSLRKKAAFTLAEGATHVATSNKIRRAAFTLAEVLITLGIIGVVAAMTMPSLVSHYQRKVLETQFKKSYSVLSQALLPVQSEFLSCPAGNNAEIRERLFAQFNSIGEGETAELSYDNFFKTYNKKASSGRIHANCLDPNNSNTFSGFGTVTPDGAVISFCTNVTYGNLISIDTNGFKKGPNAFGHDLFFFHLNLNNCNLEPMTGQWRDCTEDDKDCNATSDTYLGWKWTEGTCSKNSDASENGFACTQYAIANTCPDGSGKGYFDCLP